MGLLPQNPSTKQLGPRGSSGYSSMISHCVRACSNSTMVILSAWRSLSACLENAYFPARINLRIVWLSTSQESARRFGGGGGSRTPVRKGPGLKAYIRSRFEKASQPLTSSQQESTAASPMVSPLLHGPRRKSQPAFMTPRSPLRAKVRRRATYLIKQREPIQYWHLVFGPRDCGCMAPGMPFSPVPPRRNRFAPYLGQCAVWHFYYSRIERAEETV